MYILMYLPASISHQSYIYSYVHIVVFIKTNYKSMQHPTHVQIVSMRKAIPNHTLVIYLSLSQLLLTDLSHALCKASYM